MAILMSELLELAAQMEQDSNFGDPDNRVIINENSSPTWSMSRRDFERYKRQYREC